MPAAIKTAFDNPIEQDVQLEQIDNKPPAVETTLKNAENVYKSFLYLRKMYSMFPKKETIAKADTKNYANYTTIDKPLYANKILLTNLDSDVVYIKINGGEFGILVGQTIELPIVPKDDEENGDSIELKGKISYIFKIVQEF